MTLRSKIQRLALALCVFPIFLAYTNCSQNWSALQSTSGDLASSSGTRTETSTNLTDMPQLKEFARSVSEGQWAEIPNSKMHPHLITNDIANAIDPRIWAVSGPSCVILCWTSSSFDGRNWYFGPGGGHAGYNGNEIYAFNLSTLSWKRLYDPAPLIPGKPAAEDPDPIWGSKAPHNYDGNIYSPKTHSLFIFNGFSPLSWEYKLGIADPQKAWSSFPSPQTTGMKGYSYIKTALLNDGRIFVALSGDHNPAIFDPETKTYSDWHPWSFASASYTVADTNTKTGKVYYMSTYAGGYVVEVDPSKTPLGGASVANSAPPAYLGDGACFIYHPPSNRFLAWRDGRKVAIFDSEATTKWSSVENPVGPAPAPSYNPNGPYQKCIYVPEVDLFLFNNDDTQNIWAYRMPK